LPKEIHILRKYSDNSNNHPSVVVGGVVVVVVVVAVIVVVVVFRMPTWHTSWGVFVEMKCEMT